MLHEITNLHSRIHTYSMDPKGTTLSLNERVLTFLGCEKASDVLGINLKEFLCQADHPDQWIDHNDWVIKNNANRMFIETGVMHGKLQWFRSFRSPILGLTGKVVGISGISIPIQLTCLIPLTKQQTACLKQYAMGHSYKLIAINLGLSARTVEHYINAVKLKLHCETRAELILHAIERGLIGI
ncbi:MAG: helix-turn-helix transcriptional regulator [Legionella sp.]